MYYELPHRRHIPIDVMCKLAKFCKFYCSNLKIKIILTPFKIGEFFNVKDAIPDSRKSFVGYNFVCAGLNFCYIGKTTSNLIKKIK